MKSTIEKLESKIARLKKEIAKSWALIMDGEGGEEDFDIDNKELANLESQLSALK
jgi:hypothetical protein